MKRNTAFHISLVRLYRYTYSILVLCILFITGSNTVAAQELDAPFVTTPDYLVEEMLDLAEVGPGDYVIDLGSGDGRIVIAAAQRGASGHGVDIDPNRVTEGEENAEAAGVSNRVMFVEEDIFDTDFSRASVIMMYLLPEVNIRLRPLLLENLSPGTRVVSHEFDMGEWESDTHLEVGAANLHLWIIPAKVQGQWSWMSGDEEFTMTIEQEFQKIDVNIQSGNRNITIENALLSGDRIDIITRGTGNDHRYLFNGKVEDDTITGTVQIRADMSASIENWTAYRNKE